MKKLIELFFGEWECVVAEPIGTKGWLLVCHRHTITGRASGYLDKVDGGIVSIEPSVALEHINRYSK